MNDLDRADIYQEMALEAALTVRKPEAPPATGECLYCGEPCPGRWCDTECRDEWELERRLAG